MEKDDAFRHKQLKQRQKLPCFTNANGRAWVMRHWVRFFWWIEGQTPGILADAPKCLNHPEVVWSWLCVPQQATKSLVCISPFVELMTCNIGQIWIDCSRYRGRAIQGTIGDGLGNTVGGTLGDLAHRQQPSNGRSLLGWEDFKLFGRADLYKWHAYVLLRYINKFNVKSRSRRVFKGEFGWASALVPSSWLLIYMQQYMAHKVDCILHAYSVWICLILCWLKPP